MENKNRRFQRKLKISEQLIEELLARPDFNEKVRQIRRKFKIPSRTGWKTIKDAYKWWRNWLLEDEVRVQNYHQGIAKILDDCKLTERWNFFVQRYIETNDTSLATLPKFKVYLVRDKDYKELGLAAFSAFKPGVYIQIYPDTRQEDFKNAENWKIIENFQKRLPGYSRRQKIKKSHKRDLLLIEKQKKGKHIWELAEYVYSGEDNEKAMNAINVTKQALSRKKESMQKPK